MRLGADNDAELVGLRDEVTALWEQHTGRLWKARTDFIEEVRPRTPWINTVFLSLGPITAITLVESHANVTGSAYTTVSSSSYAQFGDRGIESLAGPWPEFVRVKYTGGYADGAAPADMLRALLIQAKFMRVRMADEAMIVSKKQSFGAYSGTGEYEEGTLHPFFRMQVDRYRRKG